MATRTPPIPPENRGSYAAVRNLSNNHKGVISFYSYNAKKTVRFKAFIKDFRDAFRTSIGNETFVGHPEPLRKAKTIERVINLGFDVPAYDVSEARKHMEDIKLLAQMLYPSYVTDNAAEGIPQKYVRSGGDPIFSMKFLNFIGKPDSNDVGTLAAYEDRSPAIATAVAASGLKGYIDGLNYTFDWSHRGGFLHKPGETQYLYPKLISVTLAFFPFHENTPGWIDGNFDGDGVPYKIGSQVRGVAGPGIVPFDSAQEAAATLGVNNQSPEDLVAKGKRERILGPSTGFGEGARREYTRSNLNNRK